MTTGLSSQTHHSQVKTRHALEKPFNKFPEPEKKILILTPLIVSVVVLLAYSVAVRYCSSDALVVDPQTSINTGINALQSQGSTMVITHPAFSHNTCSESLGTYFVIAQ